MKNKIKNWFALTNQGASDLIRASILSFLVYFSNMFPAMLLMILVDELLLGNVKSKYLYIVISIREVSSFSKAAKYLTPSCFIFLTDRRAARLFRANFDLVTPVTL